jgi:acetyl esterase/lipase
MLYSLVKTMGAFIHNKMRMGLAGLLTSLLSLAAVAQSWEPLYPGRVPGNLTDTVIETRNGPAEDPQLFRSVMTPMLQVFRPAKPNGTGILIFPGGSYSVLVWKFEGTTVAKALMEKGITCFIVKYRLPDHRYQAHAEDVPFADAVAAMRWVKVRCANLQLDSNRIGCIGFSAGGHLAATFANLAPADARAKFAILVYPVISMQAGLTHAISRQQLLGSNPSPAAETRYSNEWQVTENTPPCYITHTQDDKVVQVENSIRMYQALTAHHVITEMHLYPTGDHGFLLKLPVGEWRDPMLKWLQAIHVYSGG